MADTHLPLVMVIYDSLIFAMVAVLCVTDEKDQPELVTTLAQRLPVRAGLPIVATAVLLTVVLTTCSARHATCCRLRKARVQQ